MAEAAGLQNILQKSLECPVCFLMYDKQTHQPQALRCLHTFCKSCVAQVKQGSVVKCPTCREDTAIQDVKTNYSLTGMLDALCAECKCKEGAVHCPHCDKNMCQSCLDNHLPKIRDEVIFKLDTLKVDIDNVSEITRDTSTVKAERMKADDVIKRIKYTCQVYHDAIDRCQTELVNTVCDLQERNMDSHISWRETIDNEILNARKFMDTAERNVAQTSVSTDALHQMVRVIEECSRVRETLKASKESRPQIVDYHFQEAKDVTQVRCSDIGAIKSSLSSGAGSDVSQHTSRVPDYKTATVKCVAGGYGAGVDQFDIPIGLAVAADGHILVADFGNHRVKVYDQILKCVSTFGTCGTGASQFKYPESVAVAPDGRVYVSDYDNHRIQVLTMSGHNAIKSEILNVERLSYPRGLAFDNDGNLYICDAVNYRIEVVKQDGTHVRTIGSRGTSQGQFTGEPAFVTLTQDKQVLVSQNRTSHIMVYDTSGRYITTYPKDAPSTVSDMKPNGMTVHPNGNIIIADNKGRLVVLDKDGYFVCTIGSEGDQPGQMRQPRDVDVCEDGNIVVCDFGNHRIQMVKVDCK